jgi:predicted ATPase
MYSYALSLLTESYLKARDPEKGLTAAAEALKGIEASGQRTHEAEIWRLRGELLVLRGGADTEVEKSFQRALEVARLQQARAWELRAATSLARFLAERDRRDEAKSNLAPILASFTEGFTDPDFKDAAALLSELG